MAAKKARGWRSGRREGRSRMVQMTRHLVVSKGKETEPCYFEGVRAALGAANGRKVAIVIKGTGKHTLQVGSYGRGTATSASDLDVLVSLPRAEYERYDAYRGNGQSRLLQAVKAAVSATYPRTSIRADGQVVVVDFSDGVKFELLPAFARSSWSGEDFDYPDSNMGGRWLSTNPRAEQAAMKEENDASNGLLLDTCKHMRKIHEKQAEICSSHATKLNVASIAATALTGSGAPGLFASDDFVLKLATALLAFVSLLLYMLTKAFDFPGEAASHRHAAKHFLALREEGRDLLSELKGERVSFESAGACYDMLRGKYSIACSLAPQTGVAAVEKAAAALKEGESTVTQREREQVAG